jgi:hypothetical protein
MQTRPLQGIPERVIPRSTAFPVDEDVLVNRGTVFNAHACGDDLLDRE